MFCTTNASLKDAGYWFSYNAWGSSYPADTRIQIIFTRTSTSQGSPVVTKDPTETTTSSSGTWSSNTDYDGGVGSSGGG